jgi:hypothetical protein
MPVFSFINHKLINAWYICSRTCKGLSFWELICAFCIIILACYRTDLHCHLHWSCLILAFLDDLRDFPTKSPPWYLISERQKISCFCILLFQTFWCSNWLGIFIALLFYHKKHLEKLNQMRGATRPKRAWVAWPTDQVTLPVLVWPSSVFSSPSFYGRLCFAEKGMPYFHNFLRQRRNPSSTSGRAYLLLLEGNHRHRRHWLLLGIGGSIFITSTSPSSSSPMSAPSPPEYSMSYPS